MNINNLSIAYKSDVGNRRPNNEDDVGILDKPNFKVLLVADGMGGHASGEVASKMAKEMVLQLLNLEDKFGSPHHLKSIIKKVLKKTNSSIHKLSSTKDELYGMGTTLVLAIICEEYTAIINCGDSRCYEFKNDQLKQLTTDQTVVEYLYQIGAISKEEMKTSPKRHVLMNALGIDVSVDYDIFFIKNDYQGLLLCSDGLTNMVEDEQINKTFVNRKDSSAMNICTDLVDQALINGGIDNITVCVLKEK